MDDAEKRKKTNLNELAALQEARKVPNNYKVF